MHTPPREQKPRLRYHVLGIICLSIVMLFLLDSATDEEVLDIASLLEMQAQDFDYFMTNIDSTHYAQSGLADYQFSAQRVTHYPNPEYSLVNAPELLIIREDQSRWTINSDSGVLDRENERQRLVLNDNVIINGITRDGRPLNIYTDSLTIYPDEKSMRSESDVLFESEGFSSRSRGFFADMNSNEIRQLANGQLHYEN